MSKKNLPVAVFVYGSLKEGHRLHGWMEGCALLHSEAYLYGYGLLSLGAYPALVDVRDLVHADADGDQCVMGEVYLLPFDRFQQLRVMEERVGYETREVRVETAENTPEVHCKAFVFGSMTTGIHSWENDDEGRPFVHVYPN